MQKLISFDLIADMGFLKKPDINKDVYLTFNIIHKPAVLGILGAISGMSGFNNLSGEKDFPEYYKSLHKIPMGVQPIGKYCNNGIFDKTIIQYNNSTGLASKEDGGNLIVSEQTLINPAYRIFLLLDMKNEVEAKLYDCICNQEAEYIPYLGKNDYSAWWYLKDVQNDNGDIMFQGVKEYESIEDSFNEDYKVETVFIKKQAVIDSVIEDDSDDDFGEFELSDFGTYMYFEKLPTEYCPQLYQYKYADFALTDSKLKAGSLPAKNLFHLRDICTKSELVVQLN